MLSDILLLLFAVRGLIKKPSTRPPPLIILGTDGYSWNYFLQFGNKSSGDTNYFPIRPTFPTKTFVQFTSISTGLYPTQHGILGNKFYNQDHDKKFRYNANQDPQFDWYKGEPIWISAKKAGLSTWVSAWVGSGAEYDGMRPDFLFSFGELEYEESVRKLVENMDSDKKCDLYMLYSNLPDKLLHLNDNTDPIKVQEIINLAEERISFLKSSLGTRNYNLVIAADHGMSAYSRKYHLPIHIRDRAHVFYSGETPLWYSKPGTDVDQEVDFLNQFIQDSQWTGVTAVRTSDLEERFQMCGMEGEGLPEILLMTDVDVVVEFGEDFAGHGYDNQYSEMLGTVRVSGPGFKKISGVENIPVKLNTELYNMFCSLLGIKPSNNTGTLDTFDFLLRNPPDRSMWADTYYKIPPPCLKEH